MTKKERLTVEDRVKILLKDRLEERKQQGRLRRSASERGGKARIYGILGPLGKKMFQRG